MLVYIPLQAGPTNSTHCGNAWNNQLTEVGGQVESISQVTVLPLKLTTNYQ